MSLKREREKILKLLEEGKITPEEAVKLLEALNKKLEKGFLRNFFKILERSLRPVPTLLKELSKNPLELENQITLPVQDRPLILDSIGGDLKIIFSEEEAIKLRVLGVVRVLGNEIEIIAEKSEIKLSKNTQLDLNAVDGDIEIYDNPIKPLSINLTGGDVFLNPQRPFNLNLMVQAGDIHITLEPEVLDDVKINLTLDLGEVKSDFYMVKTNGNYLYIPKEKPNPQFSWDLKIYFGDFNLKSLKGQITS